MKHYNRIIIFLGLFLSNLNLMGQDKTVLLISFAFPNNSPIDNFYWVVDSDSVTKDAVKMHPLAINWEAMDSFPLDGNIILEENVSDIPENEYNFKLLLYLNKQHRELLQSFIKSWHTRKWDFEYVNVYVCPLKVSEYEITSDNYCDISNGKIAYNESGWNESWHELITKADFSDFNYLKYTYGYRYQRPTYKLARTTSDDIRSFNEADDLLLVTYNILFSSDNDECGGSSWIVNVEEPIDYKFMAIRMFDDVPTLFNYADKAKILNDLLVLESYNTRSMMVTIKNWPNNGCEVLRVFAMPIKGNFDVFKIDDEDEEDDEDFSDEFSDGELMVVPASKIELNSSFWDTRSGYLFQNLEYDKFDPYNIIKTDRPKIIDLKNPICH